MYYLPRIILVHKHYLHKELLCFYSFNLCILLPKYTDEQLDMCFYTNFKLMHPILTKQRYLSLRKYGSITFRRDIRKLYIKKLWKKKKINRAYSNIMI